jgi:hypothetical protein
MEAKKERGVSQVYVRYIDHSTHEVWHEPRRSLASSYIWYAYPVRTHGAPPGVTSVRVSETAVRRKRSMCGRKLYRPAGEPIS